MTPCFEKRVFSSYMEAEFACSRVGFEFIVFENEAATGRLSRDVLHRVEQWRDFVHANCKGHRDATAASSHSGVQDVAE